MKNLSKKKQALIEDMVNASDDESAILKKHRMSRNVYRKWLTDPVFCDELEFRLKCARRQSQFILARYAAVAAAKLVALTESDKDETVRKACMDIISLPTIDEPKDRQCGKSKTSDKVSPPLPPISGKTASKLLEVLAGRQQENQDTTKQQKRQ